MEIVNDKVCMEPFPLGDMILVREHDLPEQTKEGLALPTGHTFYKTNTGTVLRVGPGRRDINGTLIPMTLKEGDIVTFPIGAGTRIDDPESKKYQFTVMGEESVYFVYKEIESQELKKGADAA